MLLMIEENPDGLMIEENPDGKHGINDFKRSTNIFKLKTNLYTYLKTPYQSTRVRVS